MVFITLINILVVFLAYIAKEQKYKKFLLYAFVLLSSCMCIRYAYGNDYHSYLRIFNTATIFGYDEDIELGWYLICKLCEPIGFMGMIILLTWISNILVYFFIRNNVRRRYYWLAVFLYVFTADFMVLGLSMIRQFLIMVIALNTIEFIYKRQFVLFILTIFLCVSIHKISILLLPLYFIPLLSNNLNVKNIVLIYLTILIILIVYNYTIVNSVIFAFTEGSFEYTLYLNDGNEGKVGKRLILWYLIYAYFLTKSFDKLTERERLICSIVPLGVLVLPFVTYGAMLFRLKLLYSFFEISAFPILISKIADKYVKIAVLIILILLTLIDFKDFFINPVYNPYFMNYTTIFDAPYWI